MSKVLIIQGPEKALRAIEKSLSLRARRTEGMKLSLYEVPDDEMPDTEASELSDEELELAEQQLKLEQEAALKAEQEAASKSDSIKGDISKEGAKVVADKATEAETNIEAANAEQNAANAAAEAKFQVEPDATEKATTKRHNAKK